MYLLGGHVIGGAEHNASQRVGCMFIGVINGLQHFGNAKIQHPRTLFSERVACQHNITRFEVSVNHAPSVCIGQGSKDLKSNSNGSLCWK